MSVDFLFFLFLVVVVVRLNYRSIHREEKKLKVDGLDDTASRTIHVYAVLDRYDVKFKKKQKQKKQMCYGCFIVALKVIVYPLLI